MKLPRDIGVTQKKAWHMGHRIRETWAKGTSSFAGPIEGDKNYVGDKEKNRHAGKNLNAGRGTVGKSVIAGGKDRDCGLVDAQVVPLTRPSRRSITLSRKERAFMPRSTLTTSGAIRGFLSSMCLPIIMYTSMFATRRTTIASDRSGVAEESLSRLLPPY